MIKKTLIAIAVATWANAAYADTSLNYSSVSCTTGLPVTSSIKVTNTRPDNVFDIELTGGLPTVNSNGIARCIDESGTLGHKQGSSEPVPATVAKGLAWYNSDDNVVITIPIIKFLAPPSLSIRGVLTTSTFLPISNTVILRLEPEGNFTLLELIRSVGGLGAAIDITNLEHVDVLVEPSFGAVSVANVTYEVTYD